MGLNKYMSMNSLTLHSEFYLHNMYKYISGTNVGDMWSALCFLSTSVWNSNIIKLFFSCQVQHCVQILSLEMSTIVNDYICI